VYAGKEETHTKLFGSWDSSFDNLYRFKVDMERSSPGSIVEIQHHTVLEQIMFNRIFLL
jgi:hypothetical protein